jgi:hypothetical protein
MRMLGFIIVTSWWRRSGWNSNSSGVSFFITSSNCSAATEGTPYHVLGSPLEAERGTEREGEMRTAFLTNHIYQSVHSPV